MKTKLEVGKEYWLSEQKISRGVFVGYNSGRMPVFRITKSHQYIANEGAIESFSSDMNCYSEYVPEKPWQFTTPIAMKCTEEQFNEIKYKLVEIGYEIHSITFGEKYRYLCTGYASDNKCVTDLGKSSLYFKQANPMVFESFNPDLFLALAAMTDNEDGIKGEVYTNSCGKFYTKDDEKEGKWHNEFWRKATAQEIIEHFEKKEFVLPKFWHVVVTEENVDVLSKWRFGDEYPKYKLNIGYIVGFSSWQNSRQHNPSDSRGSFGSEITFDQFKKYVLKETEQSCQNEVEFTGIPVPMFDPITGNIYPNYSCCQKTPSISSIEYSVNVEFDAEKAAEEIFAKIVGLGKSHQPEFKFAWEPCKEKIEKFENFLGSFDPFINIKNTDKTIIPIPPTKQATLFDDRVEITDWKPKDGDVVYYVFECIKRGIIEYSWGVEKYSEKFLLNTGKQFIKRTESEAKQLVEKLKQAML